MNEVGAEGGNLRIGGSGALPWLQDTPEVDVWGRWQVRFRDVVILDRNGRRYAVFNLSDHDLAAPADRARFLDLMRRAALVPDEGGGARR